MISFIDGLMTQNIIEMPIKRREAPGSPREFFEREKMEGERDNPDKVHQLVSGLLDKMNGRISEEEFNQVISDSRPAIHEHDLKPKLTKTDKINLMPGPMYHWEQYEVRFYGEVCSCPIGELWLPPGPAAAALVTQILEMICLK